MNIRYCAADGCNRNFIPTDRRQKYCSPACRDRQKRRKQRALLVEKGLCNQCGRPMDRPTGKFPGHPKVRYCSRCQSAYRERYVGRLEM